MGYTVTSHRRRLVMVALLLLASAGGIVRYYAPNPSTLRDIGTLLLVLWLPAVGNLIAWFAKKIPYKAPPATEFAAGAPFSPQLQVELEATPVAGVDLEQLPPEATLCTLLVGRRGFTARLEEPLAQVLRVAGPQTLPLELLHAKAALPHLPAGTEFHLLVGRTAVARGRVLP